MILGRKQVKKRRMSNKYTLKLNILRVGLVTILFFALFVPNFFSRKVIAIFLSAYAVITYVIVKKKDRMSIHRKQIIINMIVLSAIYVVAYYSLGVFWGFYKNYSKLGMSRMTIYVIPSAAIIVSSEILRYQLIEKSRFSKIIIFICIVLVEIVSNWHAYNLKVLDDVLAVVGLYLFSAISSNLLYNYLTLRFGYKPIILYRLIISVSLYILPIVPDVYTFLRTTLKVIYPYAIYIFIEYTYPREKKKRKLSENVGITKRIVGTTIMATIAVFIVMIISCKFYVGILSIATDSMTGTIDKGDAVVYFQYEGEEIEEGQILVFKKNNLNFVHRVIKVMNVNNQKHYITKGDYNENEDDGYITNEDIIGFCKFRIRYIGYPTIWISNMFS